MVSRECSENGLAADTVWGTGWKEELQSLRAERPAETSEDVEMFMKQEGLLSPEDSR